MGVNPLTGQWMQHPENLKLPPALVSITNFPVTSRPQAGLSFSPFVFEIYLGVGASRFLTVFYGDYPVQSQPIGIADWDIEQIGEANVGPIRSGRLPYESLRQLFNGYLVFAGASHLVLPHLYHYRVVYNDHLENINNSKISTIELRDIALEEVKKLGYPNLLSLSFDPEPPDGGLPAEQLWLEYHYYNQVFWRYAEQLGGYQRLQSDEPEGELELFTDRLNGEALLYENVVVLFAKYHRYDATFFDIDLLYIDKNPALLFRDGKVYEIYWTSKNEAYENSSGKLRPIRFIDSKGEPFPLKPGQTWVSIVQLHSSVYETQDTQDHYRLKNIPDPGSGLWGVRFYHAPFEEVPKGLDYSDKPED